MVIVLIIVDIIMAIIFFFSWSTLPPEIPIFYSRPWGDSQLTQVWFIGLLPLIMHITVILNMILSRTLFKKNIFVYNTLFYANWFFILTYTAVFIRVILLVS